MKNNTIIIGISGASGSGKSLLANTIVNELGSKQVCIISEDSYYKDFPHMPFEMREKLNFDHPDAMDHDLLIQHLNKLIAGETIARPVYNHSQHAREKTTVSLGPHTIIVIEGILLFVEKKLRDLMDIRIYIDTPLDICLLRRLQRDLIERKRSIESVATQYQNTVRPMFLQFIEPSKQHADIIVPRGGGNRIAIDLIKAKMKELLNGSIRK
ncbi:MAG: uridine kinase [Pseudomonadota bacterium]